MAVWKYSKSDMKKFLETYREANYNLVHAEALFRQTFEKFSRRNHYNWIKEHDWYKEEFEAFELDQIRETMDSARYLRNGVPAIDHEGNFIGWREKPEWRAIEKYLTQKGIYDDPKQTVNHEGEVKFLPTKITIEKD